MKRCVIISGYVDGTVGEAVTLTDDDYIICADAGLDLALAEHIRPHLHIGDHDSGHCSFDGEQIFLPVRKDDTDLMAALKKAVTLGFRDVCIVGAIGGRFDHSIASLQTLAYAHEQGVTARIVDCNTEIRLCFDNAELPRREGFTLSVFAFGGTCEGVTLQGVSFPLKNGTLTPQFPLGVSNEITDEKAVIEVKSGCLLIVCSRKI